MPTKALPGFVVNQDLVVTEFLGATGPYVEFPAGRPSLALRRLLRPVLLAEVFTAIEEAANTGRAERLGVEFLADSNVKRVNVVVHREGSPGTEIHYRILFEDSAGPPPAETEGQPEQECAPESAMGRLRRERVGTSEMIASILTEQEERYHAAQNELDTLRGLPEVAAELEASNAESEAVSEELRAALAASQESESRLRESEERFSRFMENLPGLAWIKDIEGRYVYANEAAEKAFQAPRSVLYGKTDEQVFPPETAEQFQENDRRALADGEGIQTIEVLTQEDGVHHSIVSKFPIKDLDGNPVMVGGIAIDISASLRESEQRFRLMADAAPVMIWISGIDKLCTWFNKQWLDFVGRSMEQEIGNGWAQNVHPDDFDGCFSTYVSAFDKRESFSMEYRLRRHDGEYRWILDDGTPRHTPAGEFSGYIGSCVDITERKQMEAALRESEATARAYLESASQAVLGADGGGRIILANAMAEETFGYSREELLGETVEMLLPERFRVQHIAHRAAYFSTPRRRTMGVGLKLFGQRKDGSTFPVDVSLSYIETPNGHVALAFVSDISERVRVQEELREAEGVRILMAGLLRGQEQERRRIARDLHDGLNQKLAALSMELSELDSQIAGMGAARERLQSIELQIEAISDEVRRISHQLHPAILEHAGFVPALRSHCREFSKQTGMQTEVTARDMPQGLDLATATSLFHLSQEALQNVAKHSGASEVRVSVSGDAQGIWLSIVDNGRGFDVGRARTQGGLGLISMNERVRLLGGRLSIESAPHQGVTVRAWIPLAQTAEGL